MSDLSWKPGPPPLDEPGRYETALGGDPLSLNKERIRLGFEVYRNPNGVMGWDFDDDTPGEHSLWHPGDIKWHFGPIPEPPSGETDNESTPL